MGIALQCLVAEEKEKKNVMASKFTLSVFIYFLVAVYLSNIKSALGSPAPREKRDIDMRDNGDVDDDGLSWWIILIIVLLVFLVIGIVLFAIWKKLGLSCTKIKLMMMVR